MGKKPTVVFPSDTNEYQWVLDNIVGVSS
ncbi:hypothetical protein A2U01_0073642, partial [Trifolium medium]|nr:hypothetical protein [Trifolium medium]